MQEQDERESQRLWAKCNEALRARDQDVATDEKTKVEDMQRSETAQRGDHEWQPRLFRKVQGGHGGPDEGEENLDWIINTKMYVSRRNQAFWKLTMNSDGKTPEEQTAQILQIAPILPKNLAPSQQTSQSQPPPPAPAAPTQASNIPSNASKQATTAAAVRRTDSITSDVDEFVDAKT